MSEQTIVPHPRADEEIPTFTKPKPPDGLRETWIFSRTTPKARRDYVCHACNEVILKGTRYASQVVNGLEGPGWERLRSHGECYLEHLSFFAGEKRPAWRWEGRDQPRRRRNRVRKKVLHAMNDPGHWGERCRHCGDTRRHHHALSEKCPPAGTEDFANQPLDDSAWGPGRFTPEDGIGRFKVSQCSGVHADGCELWVIVDRNDGQQVSPHCATRREALAEASRMHADDIAGRAS